MYAKVTLIGNLGSDPEMRYTPTGTPVCNFRLAVNRRWTDAQGAQQEETTWFKVVTWGKLAETCNQYLTKGRQVLVEGERIKADAYMNRENQPAASMELTANTVKFLGGRDGAPGGGMGGERSRSGVPSYEGGGQLSEDEIPF